MIDFEEGSVCVYRIGNGMFTGQRVRVVSQPSSRTKTPRGFVWVCLELDGSVDMVEACKLVRIK